MKRTALLTAILVITLLPSISLVMAQTPSVPNLINFQGRLTDNVGNPVADGAHTVDFSIWTDRTLGFSVWSESQTPTTTGGLFTTQLGSVNPLPQTLFKDYDSLFLEIVADAQTISPRTLLTSTPSSRVADNLEVSSSILPGQVAFETDPSQHRLSMLGNDGLENFRIWGNNYGELSLYDFDVTNDLNVLLSASFSPGGFLRLNGNSSMLLDAGSFGDASAILPSDAVNSGEILDEPGIASEHNAGTIALTAATINTDTVTITAPTSGYIVVIADGLIQFIHTAGTIDVFRGSISDISGSHDFDNLILDHFPSGNATEGTNLYRNFSRTKFEAVGAGVHTYYLTAEEFSGSVNIARRHLVAMFFPTNYGTVVSTKPVVSRAGGYVAASADAAGTNLPSEVEIITVEDSNAKLEAERAKQMAELEARIKKLEGQAAGQLPGQGAGTPRKER